jgi:hypothetical protein
MESLIYILTTIGGVFLAVWFVVEMFCSVSDVECTMGLVWLVFLACVALFSIITWLFLKWFDKKYYNKKK